MRLDENEGVFTIPEFGKIQFEGFCRFIDQGLMEGLHNFLKIEDTDKEIESRIFGNEYELAEPFIKERDGVYQSLTYYSELYVPARSIWRNSSKIHKQTVFLGNILLMNSHGTFVVNGIYRIMVNQILISPGIYYRSELDHNRINYIYNGTLISDWGRRLKLEIDVGERIWARVSRK
jgi:DNA-directed RNA polymerase subunit beta